MTIPFGGDTDTHPIDPFLVAAKMAEDADLAYHTVLEFHGKAYSLYSRLVYTMVDDDTLESLREQAPKQPHSLNRGIRKGGRLIRDWNLLVPEELLNRSWAEVL